MIGLAMQLVQLGVVAFVAVAVAVELARRPIVLVYALLGTYAWSLVADLETTTILGIQVGPVDAANALAFAAALIRMRHGPRGWQWALLGAVALVFYGTVQALLQFGDAALLGFRAELYFIVPALFVSTLPPESVPRVVRAVVRTGCALAVVAVARWALLAAGVPLAGLAASGAYAIDRVIGAFASLWVAMAFVATAVTVLHRREVARLVRPWAWVVLTFGVVLMTQHRSVWVATIAMLGLALALTQRRSLLKATLLVAAVTGVLAIETSGLADTAVVAESLAVAATDTRTWEWRLERWSGVWATHAERGPAAIVIGSGYGYGWLSGAIGVWEVSPHNGYLQVAVRLGLVGAVLVFLPYLVVLRRLAASPNLTDRIVWLWTIGALVFYIPYAASPMSGVMLGAALLASEARSRARAEAWASRSPNREVALEPAPARDAVGAI